MLYVNNFATIYSWTCLRNLIGGEAAPVRLVRQLSAFLWHWALIVVRENNPYEILEKLYWQFVEKYIYL